MALQHLRSSTANKRPLPAAMADGQLAANTNTASPGLFFKDSAGELVKLGPVHVGTAAPNASPAAGGETGNTTGELWLDTSVTPNQLKTWNGSAWVSDFPDEIPVAKLADGAARQLLQTDAAGTGVEWTSNVDVPGTLDVTGATTLDSTLTVPLGSAAAPTVRFTGDTNTGIYSPGADQVAVATNGLGRLFVDASGRVGVGDSSPEAALVIGSLGYSATDRASALRLLDVGGTNGNNYGFGFDNTIGGFYRTAGTGGFHAWLTSNTERLRITLAGRVGVGNSSPSGLLHLGNGTSNSDIVLDKPEAGAGTLQFYKAGSASAYIQYDAGEDLVYYSPSGAGGQVFYTAGTPRLTIDNSGLVGIGTSSPEVRLDVTGSAGITAIKFTDTINATGRLGTPSAGLVAFGGAVGHTIAFGGWENNSSFSAERMRIDSLGRVGIGTTTVNQKLHLYDTSNNVYLRAAVGASTGVDYGAAVGGNGIINVRDNAALQIFTNGTERARIDSSGRLLVGTSSLTSTYYTVANGSFQVQATGNYTGANIIANNNNNIFGSYLTLGKSRGATAGSFTIVSNGDSLGGISFEGADGSAYRGAALIACIVDGTPGANDMPGRLVFSTTADGASSPTERMSITSDAYVRLASGTGGIQFNGDTAAANALDDYEEGTWTPTIEGSTTAGTGTYAFQNGRYTKIGRLVQIVFNVSISAHTGTGNILIAGVPFAAASGIGGQFSARAENLTYTGSQILCSIDTSTLELKQFSTASAATSVPIDTSFVLRVTGTYNV